MTKEQALGLIHQYRRLIDTMQGQTFYVQDEDGFLRRWYPPQRPLLDKGERSDD